MLNIKNIFFSLKEKTLSISSIKISPIKIYFLLFLFFLIIKTDGYACEDPFSGNIQFHNYTNIPIDIVVSRKKKQITSGKKCLMKDGKTKKCEVYDDDTKARNETVVVNKKITVPAKATSGGICWHSTGRDKGKLVYFKVFFKHHGKTVQGPKGAVNTIYSMSNHSGRIHGHEGDQSYITSSGCMRNTRYIICTVDVKMKK